MNLPSRVPAFVAAGLAFAILPSCVPHSATKTTTTRVEHRQMYEWNDDGGPGEVKIRINLATQKAHYTRGGRPIGWSYVATGTPGHSTPRGSFRISEKIVDKYSGSYGWIEDGYGNVVNGDAQPGTPVPAGCHYVPAPMPYWMRITGWGIGMHGGVIPNPGSPASHGCIRLPKPFAPVLFDSVRIGTPVTIVSETSEPVRPEPPAEHPARGRPSYPRMPNPVLP